MATKPNIVVIMTDQQRADVSKREGFQLDTTPFLDSLAAQGTWFDRAYTTMPACLPARVSMLTGRYPGATRARTNHNRRPSQTLHRPFGREGTAGQHDCDLPLGSWRLCRRIRARTQGCGIARGAHSHPVSCRRSGYFRPTPSGACHDRGHHADTMRSDRDGHSAWSTGAQFVGVVEGQRVSRGRIRQCLCGARFWRVALNG